MAQEHDQAEPRDHAAELAARIEGLAPADAAAALRDASPAQAADVAKHLDPKKAGHILAEMDADAAASVVNAMQSPEAPRVLAAMRPDDRVDVLEQMAPQQRESLIREMDGRDATDVRALAQYPPDTAGGIMTTQFAALPETLTVEEAIAAIRRLSRDLEQLHYVYVTDAHGHLIGVLSMRDVILAEADRPLSQVMRADLVSVPETMDQEQVAALMQKYDYVALPVVDTRHRLVGVVTIDDVVDVLEEEATEDVHRLFGAGVEERLSSPWSFSFKRRIGWLGVNLVTAFVAASVVGWFEGTIAEMAILAMYMPIVAGLGGSASAQAMAVAIRGIAMGEVDRKMLGRVLHRELIVGLLSGTVIGAATVALAAIFHYEHGLLPGVLAGLAILANQTLACVWGVAVPFVMKRLGFDPAQSATIFTATLTDMVGFATLLGLASLWLSWTR